jgi:hypothetical protein
VTDKPLDDLLLFYVRSLVTLEEDGADAALISRAAIVTQSIAQSVSALSAITIMREARKQVQAQETIADNLKTLEKTLLMIARELKTR